MTKIKNTLIKWLGACVLFAIDVVIYAVRTLIKLVGLFDRKN